MDASFLIVDDAACMRLKMKLLLQRYLNVQNIVEAADGWDAVNQYKRNKFDIVLMDITMPKMDGLAALKEIRAFDNNAVVVMVTAMGKEALVLEAVMAGARDYIVKPYQDERVIVTMKKVMSTLSNAAKET